MIFSLGFLDSKNGSLGPFRGLGLRPRPQKEPRQPFFIISKPSGKKSNYTWKNFLHPSIEQSVKESTISRKIFFTSCNLMQATVHDCIVNGITHPMRHIDISFSTYILTHFAKYSHTITLWGIYFNFSLIINNMFVNLNFSIFWIFEGISEKVSKVHLLTCIIHWETPLSPWSKLASFLFIFCEYPEYILKGEMLIKE